MLGSLLFPYLPAEQSQVGENGLTKQDVIDVYNKLNKYTGVPGVIPPLVLEDNPVVNAWITPDNLTITTGMLHFIKDKDELALVIGHEMGHFMLQHFELGGDNRLHEANADKFGVFLALRAGYNVCVGEGLWMRMADEDGDSVLTTSHPGSTQRAWELDFPMCH